MTRKYRALIVDLDGVIWRGSKPLRDNIKALKLLRGKGVRIIYLSNNATRSRQEYIIRLQKYGLKADLNTVINSAYAAAEYVKEHGGYKVFIVGEAGLFYEASLVGLLPVAMGTEAEYVIVGMDRFVTYSKLAYACRLIKGGAHFIAANYDLTYPVEDGEDPGAGSIVEFLKGCSGREPEIIAGKPNPWILDLALRLNGVRRDEALIVGDRIDTDIMLGALNNVDTLLVLTGVSKPEDIERYGVNPTYIAKNIYEFLVENKELFSVYIAEGFEDSNCRS